MTETELFSLRVLPEDKQYYEYAKKKWESLAKPIDGLGLLESAICRIAAIQRREDLNMQKSLLIFCADNGVVSEGVSQTDQGVTAMVAMLMGEQKSSVGIMLRDTGVDIVPVDIGIACDEKIPGVLDKKIAKGTGNIAKEPAITKEQCLHAIETGISLVKELKEKETGILATGEMGIGNTTTSTAVLCALCNESPERLTGRGAGLTDDGLLRKIAVIEKALALHELNGRSERSPEYALRVLTNVGGLDIAGLTGVFIGGALFHVPVIIDGLISATAAYLSERIVPGTSRYMLASHMGKEQGCAAVLQKLDLKPLICADLALGEGSGAILLFPLLDMAESLYRRGTKFTDTAIRPYERYENDHTDRR